MDNTITTDTTDNKLSAIERALAAAKARKAAKAQVSEDLTPAEEKPKREKAVKAQPEQKPSKKDKAAARAEKQAQLLRDRDARKAAREEKKAAKAASTVDVRKPAHMKKVERAASKLPALNDSAQLLFSEAVTNFSADQLTAIALHLQHHNRVMATQRAVATKLEVGMQVQITGGEARFVGQVGTVDEVRRIRCYVTVPGFKNRVYCFTSDVVPVIDQAADASAA